MTDSIVIWVMLAGAGICGIVVIVGGLIKDSEDRRILRESAQNADREKD